MGARLAITLWPWNTDTRLLLSCKSDQEFIAGGCMFTRVTRTTSRQDIEFGVGTTLHNRYGVLLRKAIHLAVAVYTAVIEAIFDSLPLLRGQGRLKTGLTRHVSALAKVTQPRIGFAPFAVLCFGAFLVRLVVDTVIGEALRASANIAFAVASIVLTTQTLPPLALEPGATCKELSTAIRAALLHVAGQTQTTGVVLDLSVAVRASKHCNSFYIV